MKIKHNTTSESVYCRPETPLRLEVSPTKVNYIASHQTWRGHFCFIVFSTQNFISMT